MLKSLHLQNVGPAPEMKLELGPRLNVITGDNGLGKSFLLDVAWWALTRKWPQDLNENLTSGYAARPTDVTRKASIELEVESKTSSVTYESPYVAREQAWKGKAGRPWNPGLVVYALADGGFAVWDPARNYWKKTGQYRCAGAPASLRLQLEGGLGRFAGLGGRQTHAGEQWTYR